MMKKVLIGLLLSINVLFSQEKDQINFELVNFSDEYNDSAPSNYKDGILFISDRDKSSDYLGLFYSDFKQPVQKIKINNKSKLHVGQGYYDPKNQLIYITKSNDEKSSNNRVNLAVYQGKIKNLKVTELKKLNFCKNDFSYAYAQIFDNNLMIVTNEFGSFSIVIFQKLNDNWINPKIIFTDNFPIINPSIKDENTLFFASKRKGGLGGVDLYMIKKTDNSWSEPMNLEQFNSKFDDLSIIFINESEGYISSNRLNDTDHIFKFRIEK